MSQSLDRGSRCPADGAVGGGPVNPDNARSSSPSATLQPLSAFADIANDTQRPGAVRRNRQGHPTPALRQLPSPHRTSAPG